MGILQIFTLLGALGMFLYGMNLMSSGLQKAAGDRLRGLLSAMTSNPFKGVLTGLGITSVIQSSSATTVMVVSFVNAGLLTLAQAIGVIMGANIGTTVTAWLVSWLGFKADISILAVPLMLLGFIFSNSKKNQRQNIGELIVGFCLLFLGLSFMKESVPDLNETPQVLEFVRSWAGHGFGSVLIFLAFGTVLTLVLQSSSATMAITLIMLSMGFIPFDMACAMVLGENIGTTITANIAAAVGNTQAKRAAMSHTIFNVFGVIWALIFFKPFLALVGKIIEALFGLPTLLPKDLPSADRTRRTQRPHCMDSQCCIPSSIPSIPLSLYGASDSSRRPLYGSSRLLRIMTMRPSGSSIFLPDLLRHRNLLQIRHLMSSSISPRFPRTDCLIPRLRSRKMILTGSRSFEASLSSMRRYLTVSSMKLLHS